VRESYANV